MLFTGMQDEDSLSVVENTKRRSLVVTDCSESDLSQVSSHRIRHALIQFRLHIGLEKDCRAERKLMPDNSGEVGSVCKDQKCILIQSL